jgi:hypothetical protein
MHHQFNIQQLYPLPTLYLFVLYLSENKQRLVPLQHKLIGFYNRDEKCLQRGKDWVFKYSGLRFVKGCAVVCVIQLPLKTSYVSSSHFFEPSWQLVLLSVSTESYRSMCNVARECWRKWPRLWSCTSFYGHWFILSLFVVFCGVTWLWICWSQIEAAARVKYSSPFTGVTTHCGF